MTQSASDPHLGRGQRANRSGWFAMVVVGGIITMLSGVLLAASLAAVAFTSAHDGDYLLSPRVQVFSSAFAVTNPSATLETSARALPDINVAVIAESKSDDPLFVGIGPSDDVADFLSGVHVSEITGVAAPQFRAPMRDIPGSEGPELPQEQDFWREASVGEGAQELTWRIEEGEWTIVIMNADATAGIDAKVAVGVEAPWVAPAAGVAAAIAGVLLLVGLCMIVFGAHGCGKRARDGTRARTGAARVYPSALTGDLRSPPSRWLWLVKWILVIPHWIVLAILWGGNEPEGERPSTVPL